MLALYLLKNDNFQFKGVKRYRGPANMIGEYDLPLMNHVDIKHIDNDGRTLLWHVNPHEDGAVRCMRFLVNNGADVMHKDHSGKTAFDYFALRLALYQVAQDDDDGLYEDEVSVIHKDILDCLCDAMLHARKWE